MTTLQMFRTMSLYAIVTTLMLVLISVACAASAKASSVADHDGTCQVTAH